MPVNFFRSRVKLTEIEKIVCLNLRTFLMQQVVRKIISSYFYLFFFPTMDFFVFFINLKKNVIFYSSSEILSLKLYALTITFLLVIHLFFIPFLGGKKKIKIKRNNFSNNPIFKLRQNNVYVIVLHLQAILRPFVNLFIYLEK